MLDEIKLVPLHRRPISRLCERNQILQTRHALYDVQRQLITVQIVDYCHVERGGGRALFLEASHVKVLMIGALVQQAVNQRRVAVESEYHRFVQRKKIIELTVGYAMGMLVRRLQHHQVHDVDHPNSQVRHVLAQQGDGGQRFQGRHITSAGHYHIRILVIAARPVPSTDTLLAVPNGCIDIQPLPFQLFASDDDIDVIAASEAVVRH
ncbi:hypothetical protein D3C76_361860 [compost metagenome]